MKVIPKQIFFFLFVVFSVCSFQKSFARRGYKNRETIYYVQESAPCDFQEALLERVDERVDQKLSIAPEKRLIALILCAWFGALGAHRFYVGNIGTGILQLLTRGGFRIWQTIDLLCILFGCFQNNRGQYVIDWT